MKYFTQSKTVWAGLGITGISILTIVAEIWGLLDIEQLALLDRFFGAGTTAIIGVLMIVLRVITTQPVGRPEETEL